MACCCFSNNVRHLVLLAATFSITILYANLILFNFTAVLHKDLAPWLRPVEGLDSLHEYSIDHERVRRSYNLSNTGSGEEKTFYTEEEGYPLLPSTKPIATTTTTSTTTAKTTSRRLIFFTNSPTVKTTTSRAKITTRVARQTFGTTTREATTEKSTTSSPPTSTSTVKATTTMAEEATTRDVVLEEVRKAIKKYEDKDVDENNNPVEKVEDITPKKILRDPVDPTKQSSEQIQQAALMASLLPRLLIYSAPGIGCLLGTLPSMFLVKRLGVRIALTLSLITSGILIVILPVIIANGWMIFVIRLLLGFTFSVAFPVAGALTAAWGTLTEQLSFLVTIFMFFVIAPIVSWPITMIFYSNDNLIWIYITHAFLSFSSAISFFIFYRDHPQDHPWVNGIELNRVVAGKVRDLKTNRASSAPCSLLLRSLSAWSIWIAGFGFFCVFAFFSTYLPSFLSCQEVFMVNHLGAYSVLPYFSLPLFFVIGGLLNNLACSSTTLHVRICNSIAFLIGALLLFVIPIIFLSDKESPLILPILLVSLAPLGLSVSGFLRSATLVGRGFAQHIVSCFGLALGVSYTVIPIVVDSLVNKNSLKEWTLNFFICSGILVLTAIIFGVFGRGRSAGWAESTWDPLVRTKMLTTDPIDISADECGLYEMKLIPKPKN